MTQQGSVKPQGALMGFVVFTAFVGSVVILVVGVALNVVAWPNQTMVHGLLLLGPLCILLLGSICLVLRSARRVRGLAIAAVVLLPCAFLFGFGIQPRSGKETLGSICLPGFCGSFSAAWICALIAAHRAAFPRTRRGDNLVCEKCGYNLTGNVSGVCPECGSPAPKRRVSVPPAGPTG